MKKTSHKNNDPDVLSEYDFSKGVRGTHTQRYAEGSNVVVLPPDLARAFPTAEAVHEALRGLVSLAKKSTGKPARRRPVKRSS
jgi:hypothetical protein